MTTPRHRRIWKELEVKLVIDFYGSNLHVVSLADIRKTLI